MGTLDPLKTTNDKFYYTLSILMSLDVQRSLFVLYLLQLGITQGEIGVLQSFLFFSSVALEIPSGLLADRYGRKSVSYTHLRAHETREDLVCRLLLEKKKD